MGCCIEAYINRLARQWLAGYVDVTLMTYDEQSNRSQMSTVSYICVHLLRNRRLTKMLILFTE